MAVKKDVEDVVKEVEAEAKKVEAEVKAEEPVAKAKAKKVEAEVKADVAEVEAEVKNYTWADLEHIVCPTADGSIPGHHSLFWHAPNTPQDVLNEMGQIYLEPKADDA